MHLMFVQPQPGTSAWAQPSSAGRGTSDRAPVRAVSTTPARPALATLGGSSSSRQPCGLSLQQLSLGQLQPSIPGAAAVRLAAPPAAVLATSDVAAASCDEHLAAADEAMPVGLSMAPRARQMFEERAPDR